MKTELFEKMLRKIVREELEFYTEKILKEVQNSKNKVVVSETMTSTPMKKNVEHPGETRDRSTLLRMKEELDREYADIMHTGKSEITIDGMEVPEELKGVFNKNYSEFMKKLK